MFEELQDNSKFLFSCLMVPIYGGTLGAMTVLIIIITNKSYLFIIIAC
jgi:hypothetical protein